MKNLILTQVYKFLRFFTTKTFDFIFTISFFVGISYIADSLGVTLFMLGSHLLFFKYLNPIIRKNCKTDQSYQEYTELINNLKNKK